MTAIRKTITVTAQQNAWISNQVRSGQFASDSELIRDLIRREQAQQEKVAALRQALIAGENSGEPQALDIESFIDRKRAQHAG